MLEEDELDVDELSEDLELSDAELCSSGRRREVLGGAPWRILRLPNSLSETGSEVSRRLPDERIVDRVE